jgi:hypothetical protein
MASEAALCCEVEIGSRNDGCHAALLVKLLSSGRGGGMLFKLKSEALQITSLNSSPPAIIAFMRVL